MPYSVSVPLRAQQDSHYPSAPHRALQAALYTWLAAADPRLAVSIHRLPDQKPFTVAPLRRYDNVLTFSFTLLDDGLWPALEGVLRDGATLNVANDRWQVEEDGWQVLHRSYPELVISSGAETRLSFRFLSPTSFRSRDMHFPLPDPVLAFQSWLLRWNAFAPERLQVNVNTLDLVGAHVAISRHRIESQSVRFDRFIQIGFVGSVTYTVVNRQKLSTEHIRRLNVLADYAPFCGTGHKTTQGMGCTQRV